MERREAMLLMGVTGVIAVVGVAVCAAILLAALQAESAERTEPSHQEWVRVESLCVPWSVEDRTAID